MNKQTLKLSARRIFNLDCFSDTSSCYTGSWKINTLWCRATREWWWHGVGSSLNSLAAEEDTRVTTTGGLQGWLLWLHSVTIEPLLRCRSWSTSTWWLVQWFAALSVVMHNRSWGAGLQADTWSHFKGRQTTSSCVFSRCSSIFTISHCATEVAQHSMACHSSLTHLH